MLPRIYKESKNKHTTLRKDSSWNTLTVLEPVHSETYQSMADPSIKILKKFREDSGVKGCSDNTPEKVTFLLTCFKMIPKKQRMTNDKQ